MATSPSLAFFSQTSGRSSSCETLRFVVFLVMHVPLSSDGGSCIASLLLFFVVFLSSNFFYGKD